MPNQRPTANSLEGTERELQILAAIAEALNRAPDVDEALERTLALVADLLGLHTGWIWLLDPETDRFYHAIGRNLPPYLQEPVRMTGSPCYCTEEFRHGLLTPQNIHLIGCSRLAKAVAANDTEATAGLCCHASIPLSFQGKPLGIMNIGGPAWRELTAEELRLLSTIGYQVGVAVERARLAETSTRLACMEERTRLAREIHDTLAQGLTAIGLHIEGALALVESHPARARGRLDRALETCRASLEEARRSVQELRAAPLQGKPLPEALAALARWFAAETGVRARFTTLNTFPTLPPSTEAEFFRVAQEALTNVRRHAEATEVTLTLRVVRTGLRLKIEDNGAGFDSTAVPAHCQGLLGMRERARLLGGRLRLTSRLDSGTILVLEAPLPPMPEKKARGGPPP